MTSAGPVARAPRIARPRPGLYIHLPFCSAICPYCDFAVTVGSEQQRQRFVDSLITEVELAAEQLGPNFDTFDTIYLGGGTPSRLEIEQIELIIGVVKQKFSLRTANLFLEVNPEDVSKQSLGAWRSLGVTNLSMGVQSFNDQELAFLGRRHCRTEAMESVSAAVEAGFDSVNVDLIYDLPGQHLAALLESLDCAVELRPDHLSCYSLEIHPKTRFGVLAARGELGTVSAPDQPAARSETGSELFFATHRTLAGSGYQAYEVSNFARRRRFRSRHNQKYWNHTPYLGLGPSAHSFDGNRRWWNERSTTAYRRRLASNRLPIADNELLSSVQLALETVMMSLRTIEGIDLVDYRNRFGTDLQLANGETIDRWAERGLMTVAPNRLIPTIEGLAVADRLAGELVIET